METTDLTRSERGISPVVGAVLMVAIVILLSAVAAGMLYGTNEKLKDPAPSGATVAFDIEYVPDGSSREMPTAADNDGVAYLVFEHTHGTIADGDKVLIKDSDGNSVTWRSVWTGTGTVSSGGIAHIDGRDSDCKLNHVQKGEVYYVIYERADGTTTLLEKYEVDQPPANPGKGPFSC